MTSDNVAAMDICLSAAVIAMRLIVDHVPSRHVGVSQFEVDFVEKLSKLTALLRHRLPKSPNIADILAKFCNPGSTAVEREQARLKLVQNVSEILRRELMTSAIAETSTLFADLLLHGVQLAHVRAGNSIHVYMTCRTKQVLNSLWIMIITDRLRQLFAASINELCNTDTLCVKQCLPLRDYWLADRYFTHSSGEHSLQYISAIDFHLSFVCIISTFSTTSS